MKPRTKIVLVVSFLLLAVGAVATKRFLRQKSATDARAAKVAAETALDDFNRQSFRWEKGCSSDKECRSIATFCGRVVVYASKFSGPARAYVADFEQRMELAGEICKPRRRKRQQDPKTGLYDGSFLQCLNDRCTVRDPELESIIAAMEAKRSKPDPEWLTCTTDVDCTILKTMCGPVALHRDFLEIAAKSDLVKNTCIKMGRPPQHHDAWCNKGTCNARLLTKP